MSKRAPISKQVREQVYNKYNGHCAYCGEAIEYKEMQVDHFAPVYLFGDNIDIKNLMPACKSCNLRKSTYTIEKFRQSLMKIPSNLRRDDASFRIAERFGIITVKDLTNPIQFYFETDEAMLNTILNKSPKDWTKKEQEWVDKKFPQGLCYGTKNEKL